jgi:sensor histidine kinase regulating citrate/malate metabolism
VLSHRVDSTFSITVINEALDPPKAEKMLERGYTTKADHDGIGLSIVQSLIATIPGGGLAVDVKNKMVKFTVSMPSEVDNAS